MTRTADVPVDVVEAVARATADGMPRMAAAMRFGISEWTVRRIVWGSTRGRRWPVQAPEPHWTPACMDADELEAWRRLDERLYLSDQALRPCEDCPLGYAAEMRTQGRCNGDPAGADEDLDDGGAA